MKDIKQLVFGLFDVLLAAISHIIVVSTLWIFSRNTNPIDYKLYLLGGIPLFVIFFLLYNIFKGYKTLWRYAGIREYSKCIISSVIAIVIFSIIYVISKEYSLFFISEIRFSVFLADFALFTFLLFYSRYAYQKICNSSSIKINFKNRKRALLVGAGKACADFIAECRTNEKSQYNPICAVDDNIEKIGKNISGVRVVGNINSVVDNCKKYNAEVIVFCIASIPDERKKQIMELCARSGLEIKSVPNYYEIIISGEKISSNPKSVSTADLLGRDERNHDLDKNPQIIEYIKDKNILVTGGGGSIGSELCRQIYMCHPKKIIILDIYENNAFEISGELKRKGLQNVEIITEICSIRDFDKMNLIFEKYKPQIVFHAAAHKHVPLMENCPEEAIKNNVFGTYNVAYLANEYECERFVMISTDKAVNPTNIMGASKRVAEKVIQYFAHTSKKTKFTAVRFGNVLGSNGSVLRIFEKQIEEGGPLTITHPDIIRYFMTIPEAVFLVLQTGNLGEQGATFVLDMGKPVKILNLAENFITLKGLKPYEDIDIVFTGLRPGEKMYEELLLSEGDVLETQNSSIFIDQPQEFDFKEFFDKLKELKTASSNNDSKLVLKIVKEIVPTFNHED